LEDLALLCSERTEEQDLKTLFFKNRDSFRGRVGSLAGKPKRQAGTSVGRDGKKNVKKS